MALGENSLLNIKPVLDVDNTCEYIKPVLGVDNTCDYLETCYENDMFVASDSRLQADISGEVEIYDITDANLQCIEQEVIQDIDIKALIDGTDDHLPPIILENVPSIQYVFQDVAAYSEVEVVNTDQFMLTDPLSPVVGEGDDESITAALHLLSAHPIWDQDESLPTVNETRKSFSSTLGTSGFFVRINNLPSPDPIISPKNEVVKKRGRKGVNSTSVQDESGANVLKTASSSPSKSSGSAKRKTRGPLKLNELVASKTNEISKIEQGSGVTKRKTNPSTFAKKRKSNKLSVKVDEPPKTIQREIIPEPSSPPPLPDLSISDIMANFAAAMPISAENKAQEPKSTETEMTVKSGYTRRFKCKVCPKMFMRPDHVARHMSVHGEGSVFECRVCNKKYTQKHNLRIHVTEKHQFGRPL